MRNKIVDKQIASGAKPKYRVLDLEELKCELIKKIQEEAAEVSNAKRSDVASEIADVQQAIDDLIFTCKLTKEVVASKQKSKNKKNGSFSKAIYIEYVEVDENDPWVKYFKDNPSRYPQI
ncbi:MAG: hypothetical protein ACREF7_02355 [Candidatus Saccharimonadales bacterium]